jgi:uncharacterized membrane protein
MAGGQLNRGVARLGAGTILLLAGITLAGGLLRFTNLGDQSFWVDETLTALAIQGGLGETFHRVATNESAPFLYYAVEWFWAQLFGHSDGALRSLSALAGTATIPVVFAAANRLARERAGLIAAALVATNPLLVWYSQEARAYALYVLLSALGFWLFLRARDQPTGARLAVWALVSAAAIGTHYLAALLVAGEAALLPWRQRSERRKMGIAVTSVVAASAALLPNALDQRHLQGWIGGYLDLGSRIAGLPEALLLGMTDPSPTVVAVGLALVGIGFLALILRGSLAERRASLLAATLGLLPIGAVILVALAGTDLVLPRNVLCAFVPLVIATAVAFSTERVKVLGVALAIGLSAIGVALVVEMKSDDRLQKVDWRTAAELIGPARDRVVVSAEPIGVVSFALRGYVDDRGARLVPITGTPRASEVVVLDYDAPSRGTWCFGTACTMPRSDELRFGAPPGFRLVETRQAGLFTMRRFWAPTKRTVRIPTTNPAFTALGRESPGRALVSPWR